MKNYFGINIIPDNDTQRLDALKRYKILDTPAEDTFDNVAKLATQIFKVPISLISLVDAEQVYFKANMGMGKAKSTSRGMSLCSLAVLSPEVTVFENAAEEPCLLSNPNVAGDLGLKFYAGAPITTHDGFQIGTLCIIDKVQRDFTESDRQILSGLAKIVMDEIELRLSAIQETEQQQEYLEEVGTMNEELTTSNEELKQTQDDLYVSLDALSKSEAKARFVILDAPVAIGVLAGEDLIIESANKKLLEVWGKTEEIIGKPLHIGLPELDGQIFMGILSDVLKSGEPYYGNEVKAQLLRDGKIDDVYFNFVYQPLKSQSGDTYSIMVVATEVTEQVEARMSVAAAEERIRLAVTAANLGFWFIDPKTKALEYNERLQTIFGYQGAEKMTYEDAIGRVTPAFRSIITAKIEKAIATGEDYDITYTQQRFDDNKLVWLRSIGKLSQDETGDYAVFSGIVMDVTEQVINRLKIEDLNNKLAAAYEDEVSSNAQLLSSNAALEQMQEELVRINSRLSKSEELKEVAIEQAKLGIWHIDAVTREFKPSGRLKEFFGYDADYPMSYDDAVAQIRDDYREQVVEQVDLAIATGREYDLEYPIIGFNDGILRWVRATGRFNPAENGENSYFSGTVLDITEQKEDDQRKNDFISMVSHELKTPLTSMNAYIQMLAIKAKKDRDIQAEGILNKASRQVKKMTTMINGFLDMKRLETGKIHIDKRLFDMADLIRETEEESLAMISDHQVIFAPVEKTMIEADRDKIGQVITNLISNAVKYSPKQSAIRVTCISTSDTVQVSVEDQGMGISEADQVKLFDRFYRVENSSMETIMGFGIGLYLCYEIIKRHNGRIWVESIPGKGSQFYFNLPLL
jgi:PAS domain S-box-containing protein